jgi:hypothetical protein
VAVIFLSSLSLCCSQRRFSKEKKIIWLEQSCLRNHRNWYVHKTVFVVFFCLNEYWENEAINYELQLDIFIRVSYFSWKESS